MCSIGLLFTVSITTEPDIKVTAPTFSTYKQRVLESPRDAKAGKRKTSTKHVFEKGRGKAVSFEERSYSKISAFCGKYDIDEDYIFGCLSEIETLYFDSDGKYRQAFLDGIEKFASDSKRFFENKEDSEEKFYESFDYYCENFISNTRKAEIAMERAIQNNITKKAKAAMTRRTLVGSIIASIISLMGFIMLPLLIQIERNTRGNKIKS